MVKLKKKRQDDFLQRIYLQSVMSMFTDVPGMILDGGNRATRSLLAQ